MNTTNTPLPDGVIAELRAAAEVGIKNVRDPKMMREAKERMNQIREDIFLRNGLLDIGVPADEVEPSGLTLLDRAVLGNQVEAAQLLIARGADVNHADMILATSAQRVNASIAPILEASKRAKIILPKSAAVAAHSAGIPYPRMTTTDAGLGWMKAYRS